MLRTELAIIGAGPAGMAAAEVAIDSGMNVTIVDEQAVPGGQIHRQPPDDFKVSNWPNSRAYRDGKALLGRVAGNRSVHWLMRSTVSGIIASDTTNAEDKFTLVIDGEKGILKLTANAVLIATGCYDLPVIFEGWNLPGVMATGGIQTFVKSQQLIPGNRFLFVGTHPLQLIVADQIVKAGGEVAGVFFAQSRKRVIELLKSPSVVLQNLDKLVQLAATMQRLWTAGVPIRFNHTLVQANGREFLQSVTTAPIDQEGKIQREASTEIECDRLGICFSFLASSELARQIGAKCKWDAVRGGWIACHDEWMCSSVPGVYVAGELTGVAGAEVAAQEGRLAAMGCAAALGMITEQRAMEISRSPRRRLQRSNRFACLLSQFSSPGNSLLDQLLSESANLCKCEEVTVGEFLKIMQRNPSVSSAGSAKLLSRAGMGMCQGRYCQFAVTRLMARHLDVPESEVGGFTSRFPAKPVEIGGLIGFDI